MIIVASRAAIRGTDACEGLEDRLREVAEANYVPTSWVQAAIVRGWEAAVDHFLEDGALDEGEEAHLMEVASHFSLDQDDLDTRGGFSKVLKGAILRDILNGEMPEGISIDGTLPFNFQKTEKLIWVFQDVDYYEERKRREYVGGHHGASIRIAKGLYYRAGAFKGGPVDTTETVAVGSGLMAVTNRHIYFAGGGKSFRIRHDKIVTIEPYSDGVAVQREAKTATPQTFVTEDGWFTYNLLANVSNL